MSIFEGLWRRMRTELTFPNPWIFLVGGAGLEPATPAVRKQFWRNPT
jgi:hypothetical protein